LQIHPAPEVLLDVVEKGPQIGFDPSQPRHERSFDRLEGAGVLAPVKSQEVPDLLRQRPPVRGQAIEAVEHAGGLDVLDLGDDLVERVVDLPSREGMGELLIDLLVDLMDSESQKKRDSPGDEHDEDEGCKANAKPSPKADRRSLPWSIQVDRG